MRLNPPRHGLREAWPGLGLPVLARIPAERRRDSQDVIWLGWKSRGRVCVESDLDSMRIIASIEIYEICGF